MSHELHFLNLWQQLTAKKAYNPLHNGKRNAQSALLQVVMRLANNNLTEKKMKRFTLVGMMMLMAFMVGCKPTVSETITDDAQSYVDEMKYLKAKNGLCFGVVTVYRIGTNGAAAQNSMITHVPCDAVGL